MASPLYGLAAINAIVFGVQRNVQRRLTNPDSLSSHFMAGSIAGLSQSVICSPMELAKTRMQVQGQGEPRRKYRSTKHDYKGPVDCLLKIFRKEGVVGVFRGFGLTVARETPSFGVYFLSYEYLSRLVAGDSFDPEENVSTMALLFCGGMAGICAWLTTYPVDVIKSRIQADMSNKYTGFWDCAVKSYKESGISCFGRGLGSTLLRAFPVNAATFTTVTLVIRTMKADEDEDDHLEFSTYARMYHPPQAHTHLPAVPNFPSHP